MTFYAKFTRMCVTLALVLVSQVVFASDKTIAGFWKTFDKGNHKATSVIQIWEEDGKYFGKVAKIYPVNGAKVTDTCTKCKGDLHNKPMLGLPIIRDIVQKGGKFKDGKILDPRDGKEYHCVFTLGDKGQLLNVRGYIGLPLFGRTDVWKRIKSLRE